MDTAIESKNNALDCFVVVTDDAIDAAIVNISVLVGRGCNHAGWIFHGGKANGTAMKMMCWIFTHFVNGSVMMAIRHDASVSLCTAKDGWSFNCRNAGVHTNYSNKMKFFL